MMPLPFALDSRRDGLQRRGELSEKSNRRPTSAEVGLLPVLIDVALPEQEAEVDYNVEYVEMLLRTDTNLSGFTIEHLSEEATEFTTYYQTSRMLQ